MPKLLLIGSGRLAKHLQFYFSSFAQIYTWNRHSDLPLSKALAEVDQAWVLISDREIKTFIEAHVDLPESKSVTWVHCSGALYLENAIGAHPLMTFGHLQYPDSIYPTIPFAIDREGLTLQALLPGIFNSSFFVPADKKNLYHALCSYAGNSTTQLWQSAFKVFAKELSVTPQMLTPFMNQIISNVSKSPATALSGPLSRGDWAVIDHHLSALSKYPELKDVYQSFVRLFESTQQDSEGAHT